MALKTRGIWWCCARRGCYAAASLILPRSLFEYAHSHTHRVKENLSQSPQPYYASREWAKRGEQRKKIIDYDFSDFLFFTAFFFLVGFNMKWKYTVKDSRGIFFFFTSTSIVICWELLPDANFRTLGFPRVPLLPSFSPHWCTTRRFVFFFFASCCSLFFSHIPRVRSWRKSNVTVTTRA